jgi:hypothetical protein
MLIVFHDVRPTRVFSLNWELLALYTDMIAGEDFASPCAGGGVGTVNNGSREARPCKWDAAGSIRRSRSRTLLGKQLEALLPDKTQRAVACDSNKSLPLRSIGKRRRVR